MKEGLEDLEIYEEAMRLGEEVWDLVGGWKWFPKRTVGAQWVRSTDSVAANLAEGYGRYHYRDNIKFCYIARGSLKETETWLRKATRRHLIPPEKSESLGEALVVLLKRVNAYIGSLNRAANS